MGLVNDVARLPFEYVSLQVCYKFPLITIQIIIPIDKRSKYYFHIISDTRNQCTQVNYQCIYHSIYRQTLLTLCQLWLISEF